jgi:hypothetical protein
MAVRQHTPQQYLDAVIAAGGSRVKAAEALGVSLHAIWSNLKALEKKGVEIPPSPYNTERADYMLKQAEAAHASAPANYHVKGVSTLYGAEGEIKQQWVKTDQDKENGTAALIEAVKEVFAEAPRIAPTAAPKSVMSDLLTVYPIGDHHFGMHSWAEETGNDYDLRIAEDLLIGAMERLVMSAPPSETAIINDVGDYIHINDKTNRTPASGHILDTDSRYAKIIRVGVKVLRRCMDMALGRHKRVILEVKPGNHNWDAYVVLQVALGLLYENEPRVTVTQSPAWYTYHRFGKCLIGFTHGDKSKMETLGETMAADRPEDWGATIHRYWYTGHIHSRKVVEGRGWTAESFRTLAPGDAYAVGAGYRSGRDMNAIVLNKDHGEIERHRIDVSQIAGKRNG